MEICPICGKKFGASGSGPYGTPLEASKHMTMQHPGVSTLAKHKTDTKLVRFD